MLKLMFVLPLMFMGLIVGAALLPIGVVVCAVALAIGVLAFALRLTGAILAGVGGLLCGVFGFIVLAFFLAVGLAVFGAVLGALSHMIVPVLFVLGIIWLIRRLARPQPRPLGHF